MKPIYLHLGGALALSFTIAACVPAPQVTPTPAPTSTPAPAQTTPPPPPPAPVGNWIDEPQTPGTWNFSPSGQNDAIAQYVDARGAPAFSILCIADNARVALVRHGADNATPPLTIRTETTDRTLNTHALSPDSAGRPTIAAYVGTTDPLLDAMAVTRGRFAVETPGLSTLYLPPWAEVTRVIEECR
jgi:hypothetical protein